MSGLQVRTESLKERHNHQEKKDAVAIQSASQYLVPSRYNPSSCLSACTEASSSFQEPRNAPHDEKIRIQKKMKKMKKKVHEEKVF
jgi:hypothetical protein